MTAGRLINRTSAKYIVISETGSPPRALERITSAGGASTRTATRAR